MVLNVEKPIDFNLFVGPKTIVRYFLWPKIVLYFQNNLGGSYELHDKIMVIIDIVIIILEKLLFFVQQGMRSALNNWSKYDNVQKRKKYQFSVYRVI